VLKLKLLLAAEFTVAQIAPKLAHRVLVVATGVAVADLAGNGGPAYHLFTSQSALGYVVDDGTVLSRVISAPLSRRPRVRLVSDRCIPPAVIGVSYTARVRPSSRFGPRVDGHLRQEGNEELPCSSEA
jgi:hypothetical protein